MLSFSDFAGERFDLVKIFGMSLAIMLTVDAEVREVGFEVLVGE
jgi:hypothetical protein